MGYFIDENRLKENQKWGPYGGQSALLEERKITNKSIIISELANSSTDRN